MSQMRCSIVIPTWNEAAWLPRLLTSLRDPSRFAEVIVADNCSSDETAGLAKGWGCMVVPGGTPATARNVGASLATGDIIMFVDADAILPEQTLKRVGEWFGDPTVTVVHCPLIPIAAGRFTRLCYRAMDRYIRTLSYLGIAQGVGTFIAVRRTSFLISGGFREDIAVGEDADFFRRLGSTRGVRYDRDALVYTSARRFRLESPILFAAKTILWACLRLHGTSMSVIPYRWRRYGADIVEAERAEANALLCNVEGRT